MPPSAVDALGSSEGFEKLLYISGGSGPSGAHVLTDWI